MESLTSTNSEYLRYVDKFLTLGVIVLISLNFRTLSSQNIKLKYILPNGNNDLLRFNASQHMKYFLKHNNLNIMQQFELQVLISQEPKIPVQYMSPFLYSIAKSFHMTMEKVAKLNLRKQLEITINRRILNFLPVLF